MTGSLVIRGFKVQIKMLTLERTPPQMFLEKFSETLRKAFP